MLMQAFDFVHLNEAYGCVLEIRGSDQWVNMVAGADLARKIDFANGKEDIRNAKKMMAFEVTKLVHGEEEALKVRKASEDIFGNKGNSDNTETKKLSKDILNEPINVVEVLMLSGIFESKSEARRLIDQNGVSINGNKVTSSDMLIDTNLLDNNALLIQKGKKIFIKLIFE